MYVYVILELNKKKIVELYKNPISQHISRNYKVTKEVIICS